VSLFDGVLPFLIPRGEGAPNGGVITLAAGTNAFPPGNTSAALRRGFFIEKSLKTMGPIHPFLVLI
jgi:hypothetical protein